MLNPPADSVLWDQRCDSQRQDKFDYRLGENYETEPC